MDIEYILMRIHKNRQQNMKICEMLWKSIKLIANQWRLIKINENRLKSMKINNIRQQFQEIMELMHPNPQILNPAEFGVAA